jgi:hypothetical protein
MRGAGKRYGLWMAGLVCSLASQTMLRAAAPAGSDGTEVRLYFDWAQITAGAPDADHLSLRRRPSDRVVPMDTIATIPLDSGSYLDRGLDPDTPYEYFAYVKNSDGQTLKFGSHYAVIYLGPIYTKPR